MNKLISKLCTPLLILAMLAALAACSPGSQAENDALSENTASYAASASVSAGFVFSDSGIALSGSSSDGYSIDGTALTISAPGTYTISGECANGSVTVKKGTTGVTLILNGLTLTSSDTAPILCGKSSEVTIQAADGTVNSLTDSAENNDDNYPDNENAENAVLKCKDGSKVTLCGTGTLNINANGKNGIKSGAATTEEGDAFLTIRELTLNIDAPVNDAINAEQLLNIESGTLRIAAGDDAVHCDLVLNVGAEGTDGPTIEISECYEGLEAATLNVLSGSVDIISSDDCLNAANSDLSGYAFSMNIAGGSITARSSSGDGFDSNGDLTISGGTVVVWTANTADNQPLDADGTITISGGTVLAAGGSSGMGMNLTAGQPYVLFGSERGMQPAASGIAAGSTISILSGSDCIYTAVAPYSISYLFFSSPELDSGSSYTLDSSGTAAAELTALTDALSGNQPGGQRPGAAPDGQTPELPDGAVPDGQPPELPDGTTQDREPPAAPGSQPGGDRRPPELASDSAAQQ